MITSPDNDKLKLIRKLRQRKHRDRTGLCVAEGEDLVAAALAHTEVSFVLTADDVEAELLAGVSELGSGTRAIAVCEQRWSDAGGEVSVYAHAVSDPANVGALIRSAHAFCDGPVVLGPGSADPWSGKALRAAMGSTFARPPARSSFGELAGTKVALVPRGGEPLHHFEAEPPIVLCVGAERDGLPPELAPDRRVSIEMRADGPESLNLGVAAAVALHRMARHG
ncbi:MAG TPA: RNA methyltransferase [Thermoleophilaceae bacterium]|nr:RNA methyltransferase [Thermoleophilaceae bacterium]